MPRTTTAEREAEIRNRKHDLLTLSDLRYVFFELDAERAESQRLQAQAEKLCVERDATSVEVAALRAELKKCRGEALHGILAEQEINQDLRAERDALQADMLLLRQMFWSAHGCPSHCLYGDDGKMDCNKCIIDFKNTPIAEIQARLFAIRMWEHAAGTAAERKDVSHE